MESQSLPQEENNSEYETLDSSNMAHNYQETVTLPSSLKQIPALSKLPTKNGRMGQTIHHEANKQNTCPQSKHVHTESITYLSMEVTQRTLFVISRQTKLKTGTKSHTQTCYKPSE